ncbi:MAG: zinc ABC transporter substrate-binding protein [Deltaproteobacteria bacterium]|nr:zinc ABC transporter substrate-binding protein [Deltaproteobacteria bacterium]
MSVDKGVGMGVDMGEGVDKRGEGAAGSARRALAVLLALALPALAPLGTACSDAEPRDATHGTPRVDDGPLRVYAVNHPLAYFARRIGGDAVAVSFPAPADVDPAFWSPQAETVAAYQRADLILLNGFGYARWVARASLPRKTQVDTAAGLDGRAIPIADDVTHIHGPEGDDSHGELAFTSWLDPLLAIEQARRIEQALAAARPAEAPRFEAGFAALEADLLALDAAFARATKELGETPLLFSHPVYQYLERRYGLDARSLHWEPGVAPSESDWRELDTLLAQHPARLMLWEAEPLADTRRELEARGLGSVVFSPAGNRLATGDFLEVMQANAARLEQAAAP